MCMCFVYMYAMVELGFVVVLADVWGVEVFVSVKNYQKFVGK